MKKKWRAVFFTFTGGFLLIIGAILVFPEWVFPELSPTYVQTLETNWGLLLPPPNKERVIKNTREFHGDGDAITELQYQQASDIQSIKHLSASWISGKKFKELKNQFPVWVSDLLTEVDNEAIYFYLRKAGSDYIVFELKGNKVTIYESYI
ncbi:hypothetical protein MKZ02_13075 [Pseudobacillus sp. FSL P4-0506]|uniref:hypothetical protein n=1 Tax=unclassified Pseudobacillus TaxID=2619284 RepID=UPI0030FB2FD0